VKRFLIYIILLIIGADAVSLDQLNKIPLFIQHYNKHKQINDHLSLYSFVSMHYLGHDLKDNDAEDDMKLPFKKIDNHHIHTLFLQNKAMVAAIDYNFIEHEITRYKNTYHPDPSISAPFRPPCA
jgi:hypothetical protein